MNSTDWFGLVEIEPAVGKALQQGVPVVALESTIITHGMPYPDNVQMSQAVEGIIADKGAQPAVIAILNGRIKIGLSDEERNTLGQTKNVRKVSRADLAYSVARGETAGTTVAATMMIAELAGIRVFATGGIGGVHQGAEESFDISADLIELGRTKVIVVSAGAKAILDVPKTMEYLETQGVPVIGYQTNRMPAFWSRRSDFEVPLRLDTVEEIADFQNTRVKLGINGGMLIANPVPAEDEIPQAIMREYIATAQADLERLEISGKDVTPYLLSRIVELSNGDSLKCNIALVKNNAAVAAEIAKALS